MRGEQSDQKVFTMTSGHSRGPGRSRPRGSGRPGVSGAGADDRSRWVRVTCPTCGVVRVRSERVVVRNCSDDQSWSYRARCSKCDTTFIDAIPASLAMPAVAAGVAIELWTLPKPSSRRNGLPLHAVDALELHLALDWFDQLARVVPLDEQ